MFVGVSVFGELNGHRRWDFSERGRLLTNDTPPLEVSLLDQSVNQAFSRETRLLVVAREQGRDGILTWIGLYRYVPEPRGGKGAQGAGIWLRDSASAGHATLSFLNSLANTLPTLDLPLWANRPDWLQIDPGNALLEAFTGNAQLRPLSSAQFQRPDMTCLVDLTVSDGAYESSISLAEFLTEVLTAPAFGSFKRIYLSDDVAVSRRLRMRVSKVYSTSAGRAQAEPRGQQAPTNTERVAARMLPPPPIDPLTRIRIDLDRLRTQVGDDYTATKKRDEYINGLRTHLNRLDKLARWAGLPALLFCLLISGWQAVLWTGLVSLHDVSGSPVGNTGTSPNSPPSPSGRPPAPSVPATPPPLPVAGGMPGSSSPAQSAIEPVLHDVRSRCVELVHEARKTTFQEREVLSILDHCLQAHRPCGSGGCDTTEPMTDSSPP